MLACAKLKDQGHGVHGLGHDGIDGYADGFGKGKRLEERLLTRGSRESIELGDEGTR